jgi:outer membrane protein OmpA-like peptidoglycan-associated protein
MKLNPVLLKAIRWPTRAAVVILLAMFVPVRQSAEIPVAAADESMPMSIWVDFQRDGSELSPSAIQELGSLVGRLRDGSTVAVIGRAGERSELNENLDLAERRARIVARHLAALGIVNERIVTAAAEATRPEDDSRCEVQIVAGSQAR